MQERLSGFMSYTVLVGSKHTGAQIDRLGYCSPHSVLFSLRLYMKDKWEFKFLFFLHQCNFSKGKKRKVIMKQNI